MDMRKCSICEKEFDFDKKGLGCRNIVVCGDICAEKSASSRGNRVTIHDEDGEIVKTNADGTEQVHIF